MTVEVEVRNFAQELTDLIIESLPEDEDFKASELAVKLLAEAPDLVQAWAEQYVLNLLTQRVTQVRRQQVKTAINQEPSVFAEALEAKNNGDSKPLEVFAKSVFTESMRVNLENNLRPIGLMTNTDCLFVSNTHKKLSETHAFEAKFWEKIAEKLSGDQTISDVYTEEQYLNLRKNFTSLTGSEMQ